MQVIIANINMTRASFNVGNISQKYRILRIDIEMECFEWYFDLTRETVLESTHDEVVASRALRNGLPESHRKGGDANDSLWNHYGCAGSDRFIDIARYAACSIA